MTGKISRCEGSAFGSGTRKVRFSSNDMIIDAKTDRIYCHENPQESQPSQTHHQSEGHRDDFSLARTKWVPYGVMESMQDDFDVMSTILSDSEDDGDVCSEESHLANEISLVSLTDKHGTKRSLWCRSYSGRKKKHECTKRSL